MEGYNAYQTMFVRSLFVEVGMLPSMFCEDQLVEPFDVPHGTVIDADLLADNKSARIVAQDYLEERGKDFGDMIRHVLVTKQSQLQQLDSKIYLEVDFFLERYGRRR